MSQTEQDRSSALRAARKRARAEITRQVLDAARRHLATDGASSLSLRAIARELGTSSSAVYRYVASRDELLTRLIVAAYDALGAAAETAEAAVARDDLAGRWSAPSPETTCPPTAGRRSRLPVPSSRLRCPTRCCNGA